MANSSLRAAKDAKNDEFYTRIEDINEEMNHYEDKFRDKVVFAIATIQSGRIFGNIFI